MKVSTRRFLLAGCLVAAAATSGAQALEAPGLHPSSSLRPVISAIGRGDCDSAVKIANGGVFDNGEIAFLVGRMVNEGICTPRKPAAAAAYFEEALRLGVTGSALDWATKIGLGDGVEQSYERAGEVCRLIGVDPERRMSRYSIGYACTLGGLTSELLRTTLPRDAIAPGVAAVEFTPATGVLEIRTYPRSLVPEADKTGTRTHRPVTDVPLEINHAWEKALARAPKPDATILDKFTIELPIDLDMMLEWAPPRGSAASGRLQVGQQHPGDMALPARMGGGGH